MNRNKVLVVDDDPSALQAIADLLSYAGYQVAKAESGKEALAMIRSEPPDITLLDLRLGNESGLDLLPQLRKLCPEMMVIMISAIASPENVIEAMRLGAVHFLPKSIDPSNLLEIIANVGRR